MELLGGLSFLGNIINKKDKKDKKNRENNDKQNNIKNQNFPLRENNIYSNDTYNQFLQKNNKRAIMKTQQKSNNIPPYYNSNRSNIKRQNLEEKQDSDFSDDSSMISNNNNINSAACDAGTVDLGDPMCFYKNEQAFKNNNNNIKINNNNNNNSFLNQFDPLKIDNIEGPSASNSVYNILGDTNNSKRNELERELALNSGYSSFEINRDQTYDIVSKEHFVHDNMMPFYRSSDGGFNPYSEKKNAESRQRRLETFSGSANNLDYRPRTERKTLFDPVIGLTNTYGTPVLTDVMDSRYIPSNERRGERPVQQTYVTPGLGIGYNEVGKSGVHDTYRTLPRTVDDLRTASNPKTTYGGVVIPGQKGTRGTVPSKMYKRRPLTFWETSPADYIRGQSYIKAPTINPTVDSSNLATVNRGTETTGRLGGAKFFLNKTVPDDLIAKSKVSLKENFANDIAHGVQRQEGKDARGNDTTYNPRDTMRSQNLIYLGVAGNTGVQNNQQLFDNINAISDPNMRNIHDRTDRTGNMGTNEINKSYAFDNINAISDPNMRNIHDKTYNGGNLGTSKLNKTYAFDDINAISDPNMRNIHDRTYNGGNLGTSKLNKTYAFDDINAISDPNMRNIHDQTYNGGNLGTSKLNKTYAFDDINAIPDPNMRNIHDRTDRNGNMGTNKLNKTYAFDDINAIPDPNMRNIHDRTDRNGNMGTNKLNKTYAFDNINAISDPNMRNIHDRTDRNGNMGNSQFEKQYAFDNINAIPDPNMRNTHDRTDRAGNVGNAEFEKQRNRGDANNMRVNIEKEVVAKGRKPTDSNYSKGPTVHFTMMNLKEPLNFNRDLYPDNQQITTEKFGFVGTKVKQILPQQSYRFLSHIQENLDGNPYINNVLHQSQ